MKPSGEMTVTELHFVQSAIKRHLGYIEKLEKKPAKMHTLAQFKDLSFSKGEVQRLQMILTRHLMAMKGLNTDLTEIPQEAPQEAKKQPASLTMKVFP